jgi:hypothetical protein
LTAEGSTLDQPVAKVTGFVVSTGLEPQGRQAEAENPAPPASAKTGGVQDGEQMTTHDNGGYDLDWQVVPKHCGEICFERVCPVCRETLKIPPNIELGSE